MNKKTKKKWFYILLPLLVGFIGYLLGGNNDIYKEIVKPSFAPPSIIFPIVWTILYILMGISSYMISKRSNSDKELKVYYLSLVLNALWPLFFFRFKWFFFSSIWLLALLISVIYTIILYMKKDELAAKLQIPYAVWCSFALILNFSIYILNR